MKTLYYSNPKSIERMFVPCSRLDAVAHGGNPQDRLGALSVGELNSPRVAPLHRYSLLPAPVIRCSLFR
ncbi:hypothetical protein BJP36_37415 [Moorena producens JHB]|uniref:Uncharacterized protein n=1 Tax=Moorena producens (strain JHB) TaxID=1454205 RepID=A0A9Q9SU99_MOOP1|nr:hypothetical protein [Moorena producens]WAN69775.1 hypothetical protein BJP36_37415 [Moorena producens JHB]